MYSERTNRGGGLVIIAILIFVGIGVWWMQANFGPVFAMAVVGSIIGAVLVIVGNLLSLANSRSTLDAAARFNEALAMTEKHRQMTYKEQARGDAALQKAQAQLTVLDAKRVDSLAQQRANLLMDLERQRHEGLARQAPQWAVDDDSSQFQTWE